MYRLVIENMPPELYDQIHQSAITHGRSIDREAIVWLKQAFRFRRINPTAFLARIATLEKEISLPYLTDDFLSQAKTEGRP